MRASCFPVNVIACDQFSFSQRCRSAIDKIYDNTYHGDAALYNELRFQSSEQCCFVLGVFKVTEGSACSASRSLYMRMPATLRALEACSEHHDHGDGDEIITRAHDYG